VSKVQSIGAGGRRNVITYGMQCQRQLSFQICLESGDGSRTFRY